MRTTGWTVAAGAVLALAACGGPADDADDDGAAESRMVEALDRIAATRENRTYIEYSDQAALRDLGIAGAEDPWSSVATVGIGPYGPYLRQLEEELSIDMAAVDRLVAAGRQPSGLSVVVGGQNADTVTSAARDAGWSGDGTLEREATPDDALSVPLARLRADGQDVVLGGQQSDLADAADPEDSLADDPTVSSLAGCLDDATVALLLPTADTPMAVGVRGEGEAVESTICAVGDDELGDRIADAVADGRDPSGRPYSDFFGAPETSSEGETVRVTAENVDGTLPSTVIQMLLRRSLPGLS